MAKCVDEMGDVLKKAVAELIDIGKKYELGDYAYVAATARMTVYGLAGLKVCRHGPGWADAMQLVNERFLDALGGGDADDTAR